MAGLQSNVLSVEIIWMPSEGDAAKLRNYCSSAKDPSSSKTLLKCDSVKSLQKYLSTILNYAEVRFLDVTLKKGLCYEYAESPADNFNEVKKSTSSLSYSELLYSINCEVHVERRLENCLMNLIGLFCASRRGNTVKFDLSMSFDLALLASEDIKPVSPVVEFHSFVLGNLVGINTFISHFDSTSAVESHGYKITQVKGKFLHDFQRLDLYFVVGKAKVKVENRSPETHRLFKLEIPYISIHRILVSSKKNLSMLLHFLNPPILYAVVHDPEATSYTSLLNCRPETNWERVLDLFENGPTEIRQQFCMNTVLKLSFDSHNDYDCLIQLKHHSKHLEIYFSNVAVVPASSDKNVVHAISSKDFNCYYALKCIQTRSFEASDHITALNAKKEVNDFLSLKCKNNPELLTKVLFQIYHALDQGNIVIFGSALKSLYKKGELNESDYSTIFTGFSLSQNATKSDTSSNESSAKSAIVHIRRAVVMPTHVRFVPLQPVLKSRLLRACDPDFAFRVSIRDINWKELSFTVRTPGGPKSREFQVAFVTKHIRDQMLKGFKVGNRLYEYLGGSTSQLRSHGLWFYAKDLQNRTATDVRKMVGFLEEIRLVSKYMARMGQSFSQALGFIKVPQDWTNVKCPEKDILGSKMIYASDSGDEDEAEVEEFKKALASRMKQGQANTESEEIPDSERYNFTDGIGRISQELMNAVYEKLDLVDEEPSAIQIRYAGCKGMLVVDPRLEGKKIVFRDSMKKFNSENDSLEILKTSYPRAVYLNRPLITILEQMGVAKEIFLKFQKLEIMELVKSIFYDKSAEEILKSSCQLSVNYAELFDSGFSLTQDQFFRSMILALFKRDVYLLKTRARISVPPDKGRTLFGVVDETSSLEYGEVFIQYTDFFTKDKSDTKILKGEVLVTKNPCSHPGDVRKLTAVNKKALHHIRDCIVFPAKGPRPHPDEMAGSDLDGDEYSIIWHPDLMFDRENYPAFYYAFRSSGQSLDQKVEIIDELDFFCKYIMNSAVGIIANAWLAWADKCKSGIFSKKCISITKKYSMALDFPKTGKLVQLAHNESVYSYPDFMQKHSEKETYLSNNALGHLYRHCKVLSLGFEATTSETKFAVDDDLKYESWEKYKKSAQNALKQYSRKMRNLLGMYGIDQEGELLSGALMNYSKLYESRHDFNDLVNIIEFESKKLFQTLNKEFFAEFGGKPSQKTFTEDMRRKASAWYMVTYTQQESNAKDTKYFGLPWAVTDVLIDIKKQKSNQVEEEQNRFLSILTKKASFMEMLIDRSLKKYMNSETSSSYKMIVLDTAYETLRKWLKLHENKLVTVDLKFLKETLSNIFDEISSELCCCDDRYIEQLLKSGEERKVTSPGYYIMETLKRIAELGASEVQENFDSYQEFGMFAWVTLVRLGCSCSVESLGIKETFGGTPQGSYVTHADEIEVIKIALSEDKTSNADNKHGNISYLENFRLDIIHEEKLVKAFLKTKTRLDSIEMRVVEEKGKRFSLRLTVKGSRFAIERLKDLIVLPDFFESVVKGKAMFQNCKKSFHQNHT